MLSVDFVLASTGYAASAGRFLFHHHISTNYVPQRMEKGGCDVIQWPSALFKYRFGRPTVSHRQLPEISANSREIGFMSSRGSSVAMTSCSMWNLIVIWSLVCLCTGTEASYYKTVSTNPSYITINIFQREQDASNFLLPLGRSAIWRHFLTWCFFYNSQGKMDHRSAEEKQGKAIQIGR